MTLPVQPPGAMGCCEPCSAIPDTIMVAISGVTGCTCLEDVNSTDYSSFTAVANGVFILTRGIGTSYYYWSYSNPAASATGVEYYITTPPCMSPLPPVTYNGLLVEVTCFNPSPGIPSGLFVGVSVGGVTMGLACFSGGGNFTGPFSSTFTLCSAGYSIVGGTATITL